MRRGHEDLFNKIFIQCLHTFNALAAAVLAAEIIYGHTFDISQMSHGNDRITDRNQIFHTQIKLIITNLGSPVISVFIRDQHNFLADHTESFFSSARMLFR